GRGLVVADREGDAGSELGKAFAAADRAAAMSETEEASLGIDHLDMNTAPTGFIDNDRGIGVEALIKIGSDEQTLIDRILVLQREIRDAVEAELLVERDGLVIVVHDGQVEIGGASYSKMLGDA